MDDQKLELSVIQVRQSMGTFFIGEMSARDLVRISSADVRRIEGSRDVELYLGVQRPLDKNRVKKIKQYLNSPDATFPTGVILAIDQDNAAFNEVNNKLELEAYSGDEFDEKKAIPVNKIAKILDGQHRIAAFMDNDDNFDEGLEIANSFYFNVIIFIGLDIDEQANIFATVNLAQTKVNKSLVYDLEGLSKTKSPFKSAHQIAVALDSAIESSPLYHRIKRLGVKTAGREGSEPLTQAVFVESLNKLITHDPFADRTVYLKGSQLKPISDESQLQKFPFRNLFIQDREDDIALILYNYFSSIKRLWPTAWNNVTLTGNILPKSNAFKAFMRYLRDIYSEINNGDYYYVPEEQEFYDRLSHLGVQDTDFTSGNFKPGSAGESAFYKLLTRKVTIADLKE